MRSLLRAVCALVVVLGSAIAHALTPMPLRDTVWALQSMLGADGTRSNIATPERYTLQLADDGTVRVRADCNRGSGRYEANDVELRFAPIATTKMGCGAGSRGEAFVQALARADGYQFEGIDLLVTGGGATLRFRPLGS